MRNIQISHSAASTLQSCGFKYHMHYNKRIRDRYAKSPLLFGSAFDDAINTMLSLHGSDEALDKALDTFEERWEKQDINRISTNLQMNEWIIYGTYDHSFDLIDDIEFEELKSICDRLNCKKDPIVFAKEIKDLLKKYKDQGLNSRTAFKKLPVNKKRFWNAFNWSCLRRKGYIMIESFYNTVYKKIKKVHAVQKKIELVSQDDNRLIGYIDCLIEWVDKEGEYVIDVKTTSFPYNPDSVVTSTQLATYCYVEENDRGGYVTISKALNKTTTKCCKVCGHIPEKGDRHRTCFQEIEGKRCNGEYSYEYEFSSDVERILGEIPYEVQHMVMRSLDQSILDIEEGRFHKNLMSCITKYGNCTYYDMCWKGKEPKEMDMITVESSK